MPMVSDKGVEFTADLLDLFKTPLLTSNLSTACCHPCAQMAVVATRRYCCATES